MQPYDPKRIRRDVRGVVLCVGGFILIMNIVSVVVIAIAAALALMADPAFFAAAQASDFNELQNLVSDAAFTDALMEATMDAAGVASILGMICGLPLFFAIRGTRFISEDPVRVHSKVKISTILLLFVMILGAQFFMTCIQAALEPLFNQGGGSLTDVLDESTTSLAMSIPGALYIVIVGPICEELVFRGAVLRKLERYGANFAIIVSSLLFGLYHLILFQAVFAFLIGLILAYTAGRFSLKWSVVLHIANNALAVVPLAVANETFDTAFSLIYAVAMVATVVILIVRRRLLVSQRHAGAPSEPRVYARAFSSPWLILYIVLTLLVGISLLGFV
jgi:membrane protease YdiL (CAAX protease family)